MGTKGVHRTAHAFSGAASIYEQTRPGYPPEVLSWIAQQLALGPGRRVLDLAAGTGKLTRGLVELGATVIALEPVQGMRETLARTVPGAQVVAGVAQAIPLRTGSVDAITVAQAFHWFANAESVEEMHRVLRPGTLLAVAWNRRDLSDPLQAALDRIMAPLRSDTPSGTSGEWQRVLEEPHGKSPRFIPVAQLHTPWRQPIDVDGVAGRVASVSFVAAMDSVAREELLEEARTEARRYPAPLTLPHTAEIFCYRRAD
jgi:SAM-dependent methyltransferase